MVDDLEDPRRHDPPFVLVERQMLESWLEFHRTTLVLPRHSTLPSIWFDPAVEDSDLFPLDDANWDEDLAAWHAECEAARQAAAPFRLDDTGLRRGQPCSLRWIYVHMIEEYARHNGHADLIRELIDGSVGS